MSNVVTLEPIDGISVLNEGYNPNTGQTAFGDKGKPTKFALFTADWIQLQNFVAGTLRLPITQADFLKTYGDFKKRELVTNAVGAIHDLHDSAKEFGDPAALWKEWAEKDLTTADKPSTLYGKIVWVAGQIMTTAESFKDTYDTLETALDPSRPEGKRIESLKQILTGKGGLTDDARTMSALCSELRGELATFALRIEKNQKGIDAYFDKKAEIYKEAEEALGVISAKVTELEGERNGLQQKYEAAAGSAGAASALIMIFSVGLAWPVALGVGLGLGVGLAEQLRKNRDDVSNMIEERKVEEQQKILLKFDIAGLTSHIEDIKGKVDKVADGLGKIAMVWDDQITRLDAIVKNTDLAKMVTYEAANQIMKITTATKKWGQIAADTQEFRQGALVQYKSAARQAA